MKNYYKILQVRNFATDKEIKKSYRQLAVKYHPDKNAGRKDFEEHFKEIVSAYEILSDPGKKRDFDSKLSHQNTSHAKPEPPQSTRPQPGKTQDDEQANFKTLLWIIAIIVFIIYLISSSNPLTKTTTGNPKADKELEKAKSAKDPSTGEIDFKKQPHE